MPRGIHSKCAGLVPVEAAKMLCRQLLPSRDPNLVGKLGHVHVAMMIRSHVRMEPSKILGVYFRVARASWGLG